MTRHTHSMWKAIGDDPLNLVGPWIPETLFRKAVEMHAATVEMHVGDMLCMVALIPDGPVVAYVRMETDGGADSVVLVRVSRLTDADLERLADEAEQGYEVEHLQPREKK